MPIIQGKDARVTETPNAVMTTLASPTQGGSGLAVWRVDMRAGQAGPPHSADAEQVWTVLEGTATVELGGQAHDLREGDTVVMPADVPRRVRTGAGTGLVAIVAAPAGVRAYAVAEGTVVDEHCAVLVDGDRLLPAWVV